MTWQVSLSCVNLEALKAWHNEPQRTHMGTQLVSITERMMKFHFKSTR